jgi:hypothetical protein
VVGHVQSGKTGNYTGLICKAADAGYKIIIVLAGLHNNLRSQTQIRLEEGFLGYETLTDRDIKSLLGVGEIDSDKEIHPNCATNRSNSGDFSKRVARNLAVSPEERPWLFVVKNLNLRSNTLRGLKQFQPKYEGESSSLLNLLRSGGRSDVTSPTETCFSILFNNCLPVIGKSSLTPSRITQCLACGTPYSSA